MKPSDTASHASIVVFDLGKVLVDFDYSIAGRRIAAQSKMTAGEVQNFLDHSPLLFRFETGQMTRREFFETVRDHTGFGGCFEDFCEFFADIFREIPQMIELHASLRRRGVPTFIFSNTNDLAVTHIRRNFPFFSNFDGYILSYEVGAMKPAARIYEAVETMSAKHSAEVLYLDDRKENIEAGSLRGWQCVLHETPEKSIEAVKALCLPG
jgi:putative hydrolase of the HAD superfamily